MENYSRAVATLSEESGISLDHPLAAKLQNHVMHGQIDEAIEDIAELEPYLIGSNANRKMRFLLLEVSHLFNNILIPSSEAPFSDCFEVG